jgi:hypothetical protein
MDEGWVDPEDWERCEVPPLVDIDGFEFDIDAKALAGAIQRGIEDRDEEDVGVVMATAAEYLALWGRELADAYLRAWAAPPEREPEL